MIITQSKPTSEHSIFLARKKEAGSLKGLTPSERRFVKTRLKLGMEVIPVFRNNVLKILTIVPNGKTTPDNLEKVRLTAHAVWKVCNEYKIGPVSLRSGGRNKDVIYAFCEGMALSNYQFQKYKTGRRKFSKNSPTRLHLEKGVFSKSEITEINGIIKAVFFARDLVNEPLSFLTAVQYSKELQKASKDSGFKLTVFNEAKIKSLKMGGVLAVNKGSVQPATFNILEHKPEKAKNSKPIVLVGKGVVYDTGGLSLKPTANSMDFMKCDMGGSAVVAGVMMAIAQNNLPVHVIGLIPAVENRPGGDAYVPGDVITMYDGTTVEVMNTDAEGRLILADALSYAKSLSPELVMDFATLTGAAARSIGPHGIALMADCDQEIKEQVQASAEDTYERIVEFPLWDEYGEMLESQIADLKNLGGASAGAITAGKFLQHFTDYPWMHFDIAGVAYTHSVLNYRGINGTGTGVRLIYNFLKSIKTS